MTGDPVSNARSPASRPWVTVVPTEGPLAHRRFAFPRTASEIHRDDWPGHYIVERVVRWVPDRDADGEAVHVLESAGEGLHYREIAARIRARGVAIQGQDPEATLLTSISRDPRIGRICRGTYGLTETYESRRDS